MCAINLPGIHAHQTNQEETSQDQPPQEEEIDIDLEDPEVEKAAMKIQATFKGMKFRKAAKSDSVRS